MPTSIPEGKSFIRDCVARIKHESMLDIGCGEGTYAKMFPEAHWTGIEVWEPYITQFNLPELYEKLLLSDARNIDYEALGKFDVAVAGDVLEHMTAEEAKSLLEKLKVIADTVIVSIPLGHHPQGAVNGNVHETHVEDWDDAKVKRVFGPPSLFKIDGVIGVYIYSRSKELIPQKIHIVWVGDESKRPDAFIGSWAEHNPNWTVLIWGNDDLNNVDWRNKHHMDAYAASNNFHGVADLMRYEILYNEGGFCVDADSLCVASLDDHLFDAPIVCCYENEETRPGMVAVGYIAAAPGLDFFKSIIEEIKDDSSVPAVVPWIATGPKRFTQSIEKYSPEKIKILPSYMFIPEHFDAPPYTGEEKIYARQMWGTTRGTYGQLGQLNRLKICVYAISKNEAKFIKRWADSARDADVIVLADTGSTDGTPDIARACGVQVHNICITPWRFDHARNASIALIPRDIDVCVCIDVDEVLEPGWREEIERVWVPGQTTRLNYFFDWGCGIKFRYEKIHSRHGYFWHHPCHEYPVYDKRITEVYAYTDKLLVSHHPDPTKSRGQYLDLLELSVQEDPNCPRNAFYYARELSFHSKWQDSIDAINRYLKLPGATWGNERCYAYRVMGKCYSELGNLSEAEKSFYLAAAEAPNTREPWCALSLLMYQQNRWEESFTFALRALKIENRELVYTCDPEVWGHQPHDLASIAAWNLGLKDIALKQAQLAVEKSPQDTRLQANLRYIQEALALI